MTAHASYELEQFTDEEGTHTSVYSEALLSRKGYEGQATGTITPNGHGFTVAFTHAALARLDLRCFNVRTSEQWVVSEIDDFEYFDGYRPTTLTRSNATATFKAALAARYGAAWTTAGKRWAICPREEFFRDGFDGESPALALCMAQFRSAGRWRQVSASLEQTDSGPVMRRPWSRTWTRKWRRQPARCLRQVHVRGVVYSNDRTCPALMVSDLSYAVAQGRSTRRAYWHGTNTAGFEKVARYRCKRGGRTITCKNGLGDAFRWKR